MANIITGSRVLISAARLFSPALFPDMLLFIRGGGL